MRIRAAWTTSSRIYLTKKLLLLALGMEHAPLEDEIEDEFNRTWCQYEDDNSEARVEKWERMTLERVKKPSATFAISTG